MTVISAREELRNRAMSQLTPFEASMAEGMAAAASDTWRSGLTSAIGRGLDNLFDTTEKIPASQANEMFGLEGTTAAYGADEEVTVSDAKARFEDFSKQHINTLIQETVNEESPFLGRATQFIAGLGAGMADPSMMALNVVGTGLIAKAGTALASSARGLNVVGRYSPATAKMIHGAYAQGVDRGLLHIVAREGVENFLTSAAEESLAHVVDVGQERLSKKITVGERLTNVMAGTVFGTGLGTIIQKDGRKAMGRTFSRMFGDDAPDVVQSMHTVLAEEVKLGVERSGIETKVYDKDTFSARPWYGEQEVAFTPANPNKLFLSLDAEGNIHTYSNRGAGVTLTDNKIHAFNKGTKIIEVDPANLNLITRELMVDAKGRHTKQGAMLAKELVDDIVAKADNRALSRALAIMNNIDGDIDGNALNRNQLRKALKEAFDGKHLDDIVETLDGLATRMGVDYDPALKLEEVVESMGYNGYVFTGKNAQGSGAYNGVYVNQKFTKKLAKKNEIDTPQPKGEGDKLLWKQQETMMLQQHAEWLRTDAKKLKSDLKDPAQVGIPKETPAAAPAKNIEAHAHVGSKEKLSKVEAVKAELETKINDQMELAKGTAEEGADPTASVDPELMVQKKILDAIAAGKTKQEIIEAETQVIKNWVDCKLGAL